MALIHGSIDLPCVRCSTHELRIDRQHSRGIVQKREDAGWRLAVRRLFCAMSRWPPLS